MAASETRHPEHEQLLEFVLGRSNEVDQEAIATHIGSCESCCEKLDTIPHDQFTRLARDAGRLQRLSESGFAASFPVAISSGVPDELTRLSRYRIVERIGAGGMGEVYRAEHRLMGRMVALKVINRDLTADAEAVSRFRNEVRAAARLSHPNIVTSYDAENVDDIHFLVMELVEGESLDARVKRCGPLSPETVLDILKQACSGLQAASEQGMIHRDIKPHNLMIDSADQVKILDFGLARFEREHFALGQSGDAQQQLGNYGLTTTNVAIGTPDYLAPEQARNAAGADIRSDIYSLGCTAWFLLTGKVPYPGGDALDKIVRRQMEDPPSLTTLRADIPKWLVAIIERCIERDPDQRFQSPDELAAALEHNPDQNIPLAVPLKQVPEGGPERISRRTAVVAAASLLAVAALGFAAVAGWPGKSTPDVLIVLPNRAYYPDYFPVVEQLTANSITPVSAAVERRVEPVAADQGDPFNADLRLEDVDPSDFDIVIFVGGDTTQLKFDGPGTADTSRIINAVRDSGGLIGGICAGTSVLDGHELPAPTEWGSEPVTLSEGIIRAPDPEYAAPFVRTLLDEFEYRRTGNSAANPSAN